MAHAADEAALAAALESYRLGMLTANSDLLDAVCLDEIAYGHTSGLLQTKAEFIASATDGKTRWTSLSFENVRHRIIGANAVTHFVFVGRNESGGQASALRFDTVLVWCRTANGWRMLVRQGYNKA
jgi:hypothetical protein